MPATPLILRALHVPGDAHRESTTREILFEPVHLQPELRGVGEEVCMAQCMASREQQIVHFPELPVSTCRFGGLSRHLGVRVHIGEREMPEHVTEMGAVRVEEPTNDRFGLTAVGALEVGVFDEGHDCIVRSPDVVASRIDRVGEVDDRE